MNRSILPAMLVVLILVGTGMAQAPEFPPEGDPTMLPGYLQDGAGYLQNGPCDDAAPGDNPWVAAKFAVCTAQGVEVPPVPSADGFVASFALPAPVLDASQDIPISVSPERFDAAADEGAGAYVPYDGELFLYVQVNCAELEPVLGNVADCMDDLTTVHTEGTSAQVEGVYSFTLTPAELSDAFQNTQLEMACGGPCPLSAVNLFVSDDLSGEDRRYSSYSVQVNALMAGGQSGQADLLDDTASIFTPVWLANPAAADAACSLPVDEPCSTVPTDNLLINGGFEGIKEKVAHQPGDDYTITREGGVLLMGLVEMALGKGIDGSDAVNIGVEGSINYNDVYKFGTATMHNEVYFDLTEGRRLLSFHEFAVEVQADAGIPGNARHALLLFVTQEVDGIEQRDCLASRPVPVKHSSGFETVTWTADDEFKGGVCGDLALDTSHKPLRDWMAEMPDARLQMADLRLVTGEGTTWPAGAPVHIDNARLETLPLPAVDAPSSADGFTARIQVAGATPIPGGLVVPHRELTFTGTPYIRDGEGTYGFAVDGEEYALRLYYTTLDSAPQIHQIPAGDDESNPVFLQPVLDGVVTFTVPAAYIPLDDGINGFSVQLIRLHERDATHSTNLFVPKEAILGAGSEAAAVADVLDTNHVGPNGEDLTAFTPLIVAAAAAGDGFVADIGVSVPLEARTQTIPVTIHEGQAYDAAAGGSYSLVIQVDCGAAQPVADEAGLQCAGGDDTTTLTAVYPFIAEPDGAQVDVSGADLEVLLDGRPATGVHIWVEDAEGRQSNYAAPTAALIAQGSLPEADLIDAQLWHPVPLHAANLISDGMFTRITPFKAAIDGANMTISPDTRGNYVFQVEAFLDGSPHPFREWRMEIIGAGGMPVVYEQGNYGDGTRAAANDGDNVLLVRIPSSHVRLPEGPSNVVALRFYINDGVELTGSYSEVANALFDIDPAAGELAEVAMTPMVLNPPSVPTPPPGPEVPLEGIPPEDEPAGGIVPSGVPPEASLPRGGA